MSDRYIVWEDKYKTGYKRIDDQHFELIEIINDLYDCMDNRDSEDEKLKEAFKNALKKTVDYVSYHFSCEEKIMNAIKYDKIIQHSSYHREFTNTIYRYVQSYEDGSLKAIDDLVQYLKDWFLNHILVTDKKFVAEVKEALKKISQQ
ncbi:bacteriohemerythrin [Brachyspira murdochii]|uniref:Hemerythrin-like metal-binding protein n=2 Tax=Brachyspira murdochii TaxID=84378 RepID=D5U9W8_BRAM5|nr:bacteriohemerythrin [Brachyspira murdochii]ADG71491.1 hemerythrin-like metal-binding protein [Brachyspira murdochii DSM 12563]PPS22854.1 hemerythrin [Brachyspira murdochii]